MKKNSIYVFIIAIGLILSACGSDSKPDATTYSVVSGKLFKATPAALEEKGNLKFSIKLPITKDIDSSVKLSFKHFLLDIKGCELDGEPTFNPGTLVLDGIKGSQKSLDISGLFKNNCTPTAYTLQADKTISQGGKSKTVTGEVLLSTEIDGNGNPIGGFDDGYTNTVGNIQYLFKNAKSIVVTTGSFKESISVDLVDKNGFGVNGKTIQATVLPLKYGSLNSSTVTTDDRGRAEFEYVGPKNIDNLDGQSQSITFMYKDENNNSITTTSSILFKKSIDDIDGDVKLPIVVLPETLRDIILSENSSSIDIPVKIYKDISPYTKGTVKVELPIKVLNGADVGSFSSYEVKVNDQGVALFTYTGPGNLRALLANGDKGSTFKFYHVDNSKDKQEMKVKYEMPSDPTINRNYELSVTTNGEFSMGIPAKEKTFSVELKAKDSAGSDVALDKEEITKIIAKTTNATIAELKDGNSLVEELTLEGKSFTLKSKKLSGLVPVEVTMEFKDANGNTQTITTMINVRVFSGPPSAISISYVSTTQDKNRAKYIETLAITVTDEYGNKVNTHPNISVGAIAGYTVDGRESTGRESNITKRLFYGRDDIVNGSANGEILPTGANKASFTVTPAGTFKYANAEGENSDKLVVFGERKNYEAMGKWDFTKENDSTLNLEDDYFGKQRSGLYYAVGHNYYQDQCRQDGREWLGNTDADSYVVDDEGTVTVKYSYDYHLTGKDVLIWVNLNGIQPDTKKKTRIGEVTKHTLRGTGFTKAPSAGYSLDKGASGYGTFVIWHEKAPERYRNGHFAYAIKQGSTCGYTVVDTSNKYDARTCENGGSTDGTSYVTFFLTASADKGCTFDIERIMVSGEF